MNKNWLNDFLEQAEMTPAELSREANLDQGLISRLRNGKTRPTPETLQSIARAMRLPVDSVYRAASLLPKTSERSQLENELLHNFDQLDEDGKQHLLIIVRALADSNAKVRKKNHRGAAEAIS